MGMVTINIDAMREMLAGITIAQTRVTNLRHSLGIHLSNARWHVHKAAPPYVSMTRLVDVWYWLEHQKAPKQIRLELAELLANTHTGIRDVKIDETWLDHIDLNTAATDATTLQTLLKGGDIKGILDILDKHHTQIPAGDGSSVTLYDPVFGALLAKNLTPTQLANFLAVLNRGGEKTNATHYDNLLHSLAGTLSAGVRTMSPDDLHTFTTAWAATAAIGPGPDNPLPGIPPVPPGHPTPPQEFPYTALPIQLLSLVIARGQWPDEFLTGIYDAIITEEGSIGANHWLQTPRYVWDPGVPDPTTGGYTLIADPMWGIFNTAINNPQWVHTTLGTGDTTTLTIPDPNASPVFVTVGHHAAPVQPTISLDVNTALYGLLERGTADPATVTALVSMLTAADVYKVTSGGQPTLLPQIEPIRIDIQQIHSLSDAVHTLLDILSMIPLIGGAADAINGIIYLVENDKFSAGLCFASILLVSAFGLLAAVPRWARRINIGAATIDDATVALKAGRKLSELTPAELKALENMVRVRSTTQLEARVQEIYAQMDELGITSNRGRKKYLDANLGPAYSTVYNPHTGEFYTAVNSPSVDPPDLLDPRLKERIESMPDDVLAAHSERGTIVVNGETRTPVGTHAEIYAADAALKADPTLTIEDLVIDTSRTGIDPSNPLGTDFVACPHCAWILQGATIITG